MRAKYLLASSRRACKIGTANAAVLPEPVSANPMISFPVISFHNILINDPSQFLLNCNVYLAELKGLPLSEFLLVLSILNFHKLHTIHL